MELGRRVERTDGRHRLVIRFSVALEMNMSRAEANNYQYGKLHY